jgi:predicted regulator of amino acid metabolism with ACT domain
MTGEKKEEKRKFLETVFYGIFLLKKKKKNYESILEAVVTQGSNVTISVDTLISFDNNVYTPEETYEDLMFTEKQIPIEPFTELIKLPTGYQIVVKF